jgi:hypothetical protein
MLVFGPMKSLLKKILLIAGTLALAGFFSVAVAAQCLGTTRAGNQCKNKAPAGSSYCHYHNPAVKHCAATTKKGDQCRNSPQPGSPYCHVHGK